MQLLARLPGMGPRSARRAALLMFRRRESVLEPLLAALSEAAEKVHACSACGNLGATDPCAICVDPRRDETLLCVVEDVAGLWALERSGAYKGRYHVLGGVLSAMEGVGPEELRIDRLVERAAAPQVSEVILATGATVEGQTTAHYLADRLADCQVAVTRLAHGLPVGGELDYMDEGTIGAAIKARRAIG